LRPCTLHTASYYRSCRASSSAYSPNLHNSVCRTRSEKNRAETLTAMKMRQEANDKAEKNYRSRPFYKLDFQPVAFIRSKLSSSALSGLVRGIRNARELCLILKTNLNPTPQAFLAQPKLVPTLHTLYTGRRSQPSQHVALISRCVSPYTR
jgi:hypothetical protein